MVDWHRTVQDLKADIRRRRLLEGRRRGLRSDIALLLTRGMMGVVLYRLMRYCHQRRWRVAGRLLNFFEYFYTKNEVSPLAQLGPGLVLGDGGGIGITQVVTAGANCTFLGHNSITLGAMEGFDVKQDRIVLGDHCVIGRRVRIIRPVSMADGTLIKSNSVAMMSVEKPGTTVSGIPARRRSVGDYDRIVAWNPLYGGVLEATP